MHQENKHSGSSVILDLLNNITAIKVNRTLICRNLTVKIHALFKILFKRHKRISISCINYLVAFNHEIKAETFSA